MEKKQINRFVIEPSEAQALMSAWNISSQEDLLRALVPSAQRLARPPISSFPVGVAALGQSGRIYLGCNLEFPGLPLHHSVHAEQFLVANASLSGETRLLSLAVSAAPCGHCRQFFQELRLAADVTILVTSDQNPRFLPLIEFLPRPFGPLDLLDHKTPLLLEQHHNRIEIEDLKIGWTLAEAALEGARGAHAPYSGCPAGFAVADGEGRVYKGSYMESAAYNPSLGPVQAAMVGYLVGGGGKWEDIVSGVLVEGEGAKVSHEATARIFFQKVAPAAKIWVTHFKMAGGKDV